MCDISQNRQLLFFRSYLNFKVKDNNPLYLLIYI